MTRRASQPGGGRGVLSTVTSPIARLGLPLIAALALSGCVVAQPVGPGVYVEEPYGYEALPQDYYGYLGAYGAWRTVPSYGTVWCPPVASAWSPYYYGPAAPWSFTFYFGDWISTPYGWGWVPGYDHHPHWHRWAHRGRGHHGGHHGDRGDDRRHHARRKTYDRRHYDGTPYFDSRGRGSRGRDRDHPREVRRGGDRDGRFFRTTGPRRTVVRERPIGPGRRNEEREPRRRVERREPRRGAGTPPRPGRDREPRGGGGFRPPGVPIADSPGARGGWRARPLGGREVRDASSRRGPGARSPALRSSPRGGSPSRRSLTSAGGRPPSRSVGRGGRSPSRSVRSGGRSSSRSVKGGGRGGGSGGRGQRSGRR